MTKIRLQAGKDRTSVLLVALFSRAAVSDSSSRKVDCPPKMLSRAADTHLGSEFVFLGPHMQQDALEPARVLCSVSFEA